MDETKKALLNTLNLISELDLIEKRKTLEFDLEVMKLKRGIESLQERIKIKDDIIDDLKDIIQLLKGSTKKGEDKKGEDKK